jgi:hypothetical protein
VVYVEINWYQKNTRPFTLTSYGIEGTYFELLEQSAVKNFLYFVFSDKARKSENKQPYTSKGQSECYKVRDFTDTGFGYYFYSNSGDKTLTETIKFKNFKGLQLLPPYQGNKARVKVKPGE